jgi:hypothetical protein
MASSDEKSLVVDISSALRREASSNKRDIVMATIEDDDERLLNQIGYTQVRLPQNPLRIAPSLTTLQDLSRHFSKWSTLSYAISVLGVLGSVPATFGIPLSLGGPAATIWAWFIGSLMASCISASGI